MGAEQKDRVGFDRVVDLEYDRERRTGGDGLSGSGTRGVNGWVE